MKRFILIHYGEIGLKGANAGYFVEKLRKRIEVKLEKKFKETLPVRHTLRRILVELPPGFKEKDEKKYAEIVWKIFGIKNFRFVYEGAADIQKIPEEIWKKMPKTMRDLESFCVRVRRAMTLPFNSAEAEREISANLLEKGLGMKGKMKGADLQIDIEFFNDHGYFSFRKYKGVGGLSANTQGKLVCLLSSGIDSPVAAYLMMKRGARVIFVHFYGYPYTDKSERDQVNGLVEILSDFQFGTKLHLVPFGKFQKAVATSHKIPAKVRTIVYRRMMLRIAQKISRKEKANGIVTGDNFGQVASQTSDNLFAIHEACTIPVFQPLIGYDKEDIIRISEQIGTFEISKQPCQESCVNFAPKSPELKANVYDLMQYEKNLDIEGWVKKTLKEAELITY